MSRTLLVAVLTVVLQSPYRVLARQQPAAPVSTAQQVPPASVLTLVRQAQRSGSAGDWSEAARLWGRVVELNPVQPSWWYSLGDAHYRARDYKNAIPAFEKAAELGAPLMGGYYSVCEIARSYALAGDTARAIQELERAFRLGFPNVGQAARDPDLASIRQDPRVVEWSWSGTAIRRFGISASTRCSAPRCRCGSSGSRRGCS